MESVLQDVRLAFRTARKAPGFFAAAVLTIALGIGATTAIFTVVDRVVLRPLPFPDSERTFLLCETSPRVADYCVASPANVADWASSVPALEAAGVGRGESVVLNERGETTGVPGGIATAGFFRALGLQPALGRLIEDADLHPSRNRVALVTDGFWRQHLGARPGAVGETIVMNDRPYTLIGVLRADAYIPTFDFVQVWRPLTTSIDDTSRRQWRGFMALGKRDAGATPAQLATQLEVARARLASAYPAENTGWGLRTESVREHTVGSVSATLWLFLGAVGLVLAIACVNVASLMLVRASVRGPEFALRASLGAGRGRLIRQLLTESSVLGVAGGVGGWVLAALATRALIALAPADIPRLDEVRPDAMIALFTTALSVVTALLFGLAPARAAARMGTADGLRSARQVERGRSRLRLVLVAAELTLAVVLLFAAGLLTRSFGRLLAWDPGFDRTGVSVSFLLVPPNPGVTSRTAVPVLERAREAAASLAGVTNAGLGSGGPLFGSGTEPGAVVLPERPGAEAGVADWYDVDAHYFETLGRRIVRGRPIMEADAEGTSPVAVVNEAFVTRFFAAGDPIGRSVTVHDHAADIVGVVSDVRPMRPDRATAPEIFWPIRQYPRLAAYLVVRTAGDVPGLEQAIKARTAALGAGFRAGSLVPIDRNFRRSLVSPRFNMLLIGSFAIVAILLAAVGIYGVLAYSVASRTAEIGLRMALGASPRRLVGRIVMEATGLAIGGLVAGLALALIFGRLLAAWLYGLSPADPLTLVLTACGVLAVAAVAGYIPARRASRIDPLVALRPE